MTDFTPYQLCCIQDAAAIQPTGPLPVSVPIRKACPSCSRLYMAWAGEPDDDEKRIAYLMHRAGCGMRMGTK